MITPASIADSTMAEEVLSQFGTPIVLGDMGYLGQVLHDRLELKEIERVFSFLTNHKKNAVKVVLLMVF